MDTTPFKLPFHVQEPARALGEVLLSILGAGSHPEADKVNAALQAYEAAWLREVAWAATSGARQRDGEVRSLDARVAKAEGALVRMRELIDETIPAKEIAHGKD